MWLLASRLMVSRFDNDPRHAPIGYPQFAPGLQSVSSTLLPPERLEQCEIWKNVYADMLLRSELYLLRAEILQFDFVQQSGTTIMSVPRADVEKGECGVGESIHIYNTLMEES